MSDADSIKHDNLLAENERLQKELRYRVHTDEDIAVQNKEIERLRSALQQIADLRHDEQDGRAVTMARAAIREESK